MPQIAEDMFIDFLVTLSGFMLYSRHDLRSLGKFDADWRCATGNSRISERSKRGQEVNALRAWSSAQAHTWNCRFKASTCCCATSFASHWTSSDKHHSCQRRDDNAEHQRQSCGVRSIPRHAPNLHSGHSRTRDGEDPYTKHHGDKHDKHNKSYT